MRCVLVLLAALSTGCTTLHQDEHSFEVTVRTEVEDVSLAQRLALQYLAARSIVPASGDYFVVARSKEPRKNSCDYDISYQTCGSSTITCVRETCANGSCAYTEPEGVDGLSTEFQCRTR